MQDIEPVVLPQEFCALHQAVAAKADGIAAKLFDLETVLVAIAGSDVSAVAFAHDLDFMDVAAQSRRAWPAGTSQPATARPAMAAHADW